MEARIRYELWLMLLSLITGGWLMAVYDGLRLLRMAVRHSPLFVGIEDLGYWIYAGFMTFMLLYEQNDGKLRLYVILGVFGGMLLYDRWISRFFFRCLKKTEKCYRMIKGRLSGRAAGSSKDGEGRDEVQRKIKTHKTI